MTYQGYILVGHYKDGSKMLSAMIFHRDRVRITPRLSAFKLSFSLFLLCTTAIFFHNVKSDMLHQFETGKLQH